MSDHPIIVALETELRELEQKSLEVPPTKADRDTLLAFRDKIMETSQGITGDEVYRFGRANYDALDSLSERATRVADRQKEFFENNDERWAD